ncbi:MAG TPA: tetratricopeptide repeat protein [Bryobacteraceae bacterium]|nr:tetratricopeptide repeat protein [Bryobacteraceae bacterium]
MGRAKIAGVVTRTFLALLIFTSLCAAESATYRNTAPAVAYTGSRTCAGCHPKIYRDYTGAAMGRSMALATSAAHLGSVPASTSIFNEKLNRHFEVFRQGAALYQSEYELDSSGHEVFRTSHKLEYAIGSGVNGYTYIVRREDHLFQSPLSYYARRKTWDLSPGYEFADYGFNRPIAAACIGCHSGQPQPVRDHAGLFGDPAFRELAIGCENCHGPGALHAAEKAKGVAGGKGADRTIVNPAKLPARLAEDICMNCHQGSDTRVLRPGKDYFDFRPGTPLRDTLAILRIPLKRDAVGQSDLLEHHFSMQLSRCYRASNGRLSCLTCHQIHSMPRPAEAAAYYRARCLTCHDLSSCRVPRPQRRASADDCAGCHMPKRPVEVIAHSALTNHRIIVRADEPLPEEAFAQTTPDLPDLVYVNRPPRAAQASLPPIMLLQAYGELMEKDPVYQPRYLAVLDQLSHMQPDQPLVQAALGRKMLRGAPDRNAQAIVHLSRAIEMGFTAPTVYQDFAEALSKAGRTQEAVGALLRGITISPYAPALYQALALDYINLKRYPEAKKTLERYVELFPEDDFVRGLLLKVR